MGAGGGEVGVGLQHPVHFVGRRDAGDHLFQRGAPERQHPPGDRRLADLDLRRVARDHVPDRLGERQDLVDAGAPLVPRAAAFGTSGPTVDGDVGGDPQPQDVPLRGVDLYPAFLADLADQALRHDSDDRGGDQIGGHSEVAQPGDRRHGGVGVDRGEHQVPREGRLNGDRGRIQVAHLPHHDDVGVLPQHRPEHDGEAEADLLLHRHLVDPRQLVLDRVFDRRDVVLDGFDPVQDPVEGGRLSRSGGSRDEDDPLRTGDDLHHLRQFAGGKPDRLQRDVRVGGVEDPDDHFLTIIGRDRGDPQVEAAPPHADADPAVLR